MPADAKEILDDAVDRREALEVRDRFEAAHLALAVAGRLMRHFDAIVRIRGWAVQDRRDQGTAGGLIARQGVGARMRAGLRASNRRARHLPMRYETGLPSSVIRFRTLHASTASRRCPDELRARRQSPTIDLYRKNAFSTRAC